MRIDVFEYTGRGGREYNEDSVGSHHDEYGGIFVVADGLGGHLRGDEASAAAVDAIISGWDTTRLDIAGQLSEKITEANRSILMMQKQQRCVMKTTVAALSFCGTNAVWANSGDSRVYYIHRNQLCGCTNDHSVAFKKYKSGEITRDQIGTDEDQSCLLRTLGNEERFEPEIYSGAAPLEPGDAFFLCSDGAWEYLKDAEILIDYLKAENAERWAELLMLRIMERIDGKNDNLSLLTVMLQD